MDVQGWENIVHNLISLAREQISLARLLKKKAQFHQDMRDLLGISPVDHDLIPTLLNYAWIMRLQARKTLQKIEIENGKMYVQGIVPVRLDVWLNGRMYKEWPEYHQTRMAHPDLMEG